LQGAKLTAPLAPFAPDTANAVDEMSEQTSLDSFKVRVEAVESWTPLDHTDVDDDSDEEE
jgi:hypothetical protein